MAISDKKMYEEMKKELEQMSGREFGEYFSESMHIWALSKNSGYFLTDDRPDEDGKYTDHGRIHDGAYLATCIYDGVLG